MLFWLMSKHHSFYTLCLCNLGNLVVNNSDYLFWSNNRLAVMNLIDVGGNKLYFIKLK